MLWSKCISKANGQFAVKLYVDIHGLHKMKRR